MRQPTPGKIFLADERGVAESDRFRRFSTFSFGPFAHPHKGPFGRLYGWNEEILAGGHALDFTVAEASHVLILPITGTVTVVAGESLETTADVEEMQVLNVPAGSVLRVQNPYEEELVSFLHIWLLADSVVSTATTQRATFSLETAPGQLQLLAPEPADIALPVAVSLGRFAGREETVYQLSKPENSFFAFVLAGAFEVEGRLMHEKDGLALWNAAAVELEALSNDAIVIVLEIEKQAAS